MDAAEPLTKQTSKKAVVDFWLMFAGIVTLLLLIPGQRPEYPLYARSHGERIDSNWKDAGTASGFIENLKPGDTGEIELHLTLAHGRGLRWSCLIDNKPDNQCSIIRRSTSD